MGTNPLHLDDRSALLGGALGFGEQLRRGNLVGNGERNQRPEGDVHRAALDPTQVLGMNPDPLGRWFLCQACLFAKATDAIAELALLALDGAFERTAAPNLRTAVSVGGWGTGHFPSGLRDSTLDIHNS